MLGLGDPVPGTGGHGRSLQIAPAPLGAFAVMQQPWLQHGASPVHLWMEVTIHHPGVFSPGTHGTRPSPAAASLGTKRGDPCSPHSKVSFSTVLQCRYFGKAPVHAQPCHRHGRAPETRAHRTQIAPEQGTAAKKPPQGFLAIL